MKHLHYLSYMLRHKWFVLVIAPERVVVAVFENQTGDPGLAHLGPMASDWITQGLAQTGLLDVVVARAGLADDPSEGATEGRIRRLADETGAAIVVSGAYYRQGEQVQFQRRIGCSCR